jgi:hypothetical protein
MIKIKKIKPMFTSLVTTMDRYDEDVIDNNLIIANKQKGDVKEYQTVIAVGDSVRGIKVGDLVCINPIRYGRTKHKDGTLKDGIVSDNPIIEYCFNVIELDGKQDLLLEDRDINFVIEDYEEVKDKPKSTLIQPRKKEIIL